MKASEKLIARRNAIVPEGMGMFTPLTIASGSGAVIRDVDGRSYIDFAGGIGVLNAGHCPRPVVQAITRQAQQLMHACFPVAMDEPYVELCETLAKLFPHGKKTKVMLTNSGLTKYRIEFEQLVENGLIEIEYPRIKLTRKGKLYSNVVFAVFV